MRKFEKASITCQVSTGAGLWFETQLGGDHLPYRCTQLKTQVGRSSIFCQNPWGPCFWTILKGSAPFCVLLHSYKFIFLICLGVSMTNTLTPHPLTSHPCVYFCIKIISVREVFRKLKDFEYYLEHSVNVFETLVRKTTALT